MRSSPQASQTVDIDQLVANMIRNGVDSTPRPEGMEEWDFCQIQKVVRGMGGFFPENALGIVRRKDHRVLGGEIYDRSHGMWRLSGC